MRTAKGTECKGSHEFNGKRGMAMFDVYEWDGKRYSVCAHQVGESGYCGKLIELGDGPAVICCGEHDE